MRNTKLRTVCALLGCLLMTSSAVLAQQVNVAQASGQVTDNTGAVVPAATVRMIETQRGVVHTAQTDSQGRYVLPGLPVGEYRLEVQKESFKIYVQQGIVLQVNDHVTLNGVLQTGTVSQVVEVNAGAAAVQTEGASVSNVIESKPISELPLNGRQATQLVLVSGASMMAPGGDETGSKNFYSSVTISVAGGQANATNYLLDGGDNNDTFSNVNLPFPFPDALQEFSVETSSLPARNGLHPGGVVNLVTKSGTNSLHGNAFEFYRDGAFNARPRAFTPAGTKQDNLLRNQFGGTLGGKIITDKLFFFAGYQGTRQHSNATANTHTFTKAALTGDFTTLASAACQSNKKDKTLNPAFAPGNKLDPTKFDPAAFKLLTAGYIPVSSDPCAQFSYGVPAIDNEDEIVGRMDYVLNPNHSLYGRYLIDDFRAPAPFSPTNLVLTTTPGNLERAQSFTLGDNYAFTPTLMNSFHFTFTRRRDNRGSDPRDINPTTLGSNMFAAVPNFLLLSISGYFGVGCGTCAPGFFNVNSWTEADDVDWIHGRHHFAFGALAIRTQNNTLTGFDENGTFSFNGQVTGDGLADFLLGQYNGSGGLGFTQSRAQKVAYRETIPSVYGQDTIRLGPKLTVTAGLRWEPSLFPSDVFHRGSIFNLQAFQNNQHSSVFPTAPAGMLFFGDPGVPAAFTNNHLMNFAPRIGVAYDPSGSGKASIRAGYGIFYDSSMVWYSQRLTSNPPVVNQIDVPPSCGTFSNPWQNYPSCIGGSGTSQNPFPGGTISFPASSFWVSLPPNLRPMYMQQWNFSVQSLLGRDWVMSLSYLGSKSLHVPLSYDFNAPQITPSACAAVGGCKTSNESQRRRLALLAGSASAPQNASAIGGLDVAYDEGYANYNGFLASLQHRFAKGLSVQTNYTFSKCLSMGDFNGDLRGTYFQDQDNPKGDYGPCNFDIKHIYNATLVAESPFKAGGLRGAFLGGWQFSSTFRATSGWPINITDGADIAETGEGMDRPNLVPGQPLYLKQWQSCGANWCYQWFNPAAFSVPKAAPGAFGNLARDTAYSPGVINFDAKIVRRFKIHEEKQLEFAFEAFNAINHFNPSIGGPGTTAGINNSSNFGRQTAASTPGFVPSVYDPRILQFSSKFYF